MQDRIQIGPDEIDIILLDVERSKNSSAEAMLMALV